MRRRLVPTRSSRTWWWVFALFIATPAIALAALGIRSIRAADIERNERLRDAQSAVARRVDAALDEALTREGALGAALTQSDSRFAFLLEQDGVLTFPADRVYFGPFGLKPSALAAESLSASLAATLDEAQAAEAQRRYPDARRSYERLRSSPSLTSWVRVRLALLDINEGDRAKLNVVTDVRLAASESRTPSGIPLAVASATYARTMEAVDRPGFAPLISATLKSLHDGRWWLAADQRRAYDAELRQLLSESGASSPADGRLERLAALEAALRSMASASRNGPATFARTKSGDLIVTSPATIDAASPWQGTAIVGPAVTRLLEDAAGPLVRGVDFDVALRTRRGDAVWGNAAATGAWNSVPISTVEGWELAFSASPLPPSTKALNYGLVLLPVVLLASGLAMTAWIVRRDLALARLRSTFIASVTHEFKSPITSIRLLIERLASGRLEATEDASRYYAAVGAEIDRLEGLVNRVLESQKLQDGQKHYSFRPVSLEDLARSIIDRFRPHAEARGIGLELHVEPGNPAASIDRESIADAVGNLVDNAIKYSPPGTTVRVTIRADEEGVRLDVIDEGIGVDPQDAQRIFEPFFRTRRGDQANVQGTGLGLSLVKAAAEAHGGSATVVSDGRHGSCFTLRLPRPRIDDTSAMPTLGSTEVQSAPRAQ